MFFFSLALKMLHQIHKITFIKKSVLVINVFGERNKTMFKVYKNREEAGKFLGEKLLEYQKLEPLILALPKGGVIVGQQVSIKLNAQLDFIQVTKIGNPANEEFTIEKVPAISLSERSIIIVDDGLATGATMKAAIAWVKTQNVKKIIVAVPVSSMKASSMIKSMVDEFISLVTPKDMVAIGMWYQDFELPQHEIKEHYSKPTKENIVNEIEENSTPFTNIGDLKSWLKKISKNKIIMLGEATHGTKEFYSIRREISQILMKDYGYNFIAVEGDWPDCNRMNDYIKKGDKENPKEIIQGQFHRWPTWMWANEEIPPLMEWMKENDIGCFYGLDVYSFFESLDELKKRVDHIESSASMRILELHKCFEPFKGNEIAYAKSLLNSTEGCGLQVMATLRAILRIKLQDTTLSKEAFFDLKQNARVVVNAEKYYRAMLIGGAESWNVRDLHMLETLENLLQLHGTDAKAIVWAHNTHIGDYHATDMLDNGYINLGGLARERFGVDEVFLLGFSTYEGEVMAGASWGSVEKVNKLPQAQQGTYEDYFHQASMGMNASQFLTTFDKLGKDSLLNRKLGHRAVGVVYDPNHESRSNYVPTQMRSRYDGLIFVDRTHAVTSLNKLFANEEFPETWPLGQ